MGVQRARLHLGVVAPDDLTQVIARQQPTLILEQGQRQREFTVGDFNGLAIHLDAIGRSQKAIRTKGQNALGRQRVCAAQQGGNAGSQLTSTHRLDHEVIRAAAQTFNDVGLFTAMRDEDDWQILADLLAHPAHDLGALNIGQLPVDQ